jgi:ABC-type bacteriocin/lantibiotic exporter with double-glycine peptidase domain
MNEALIVFIVIGLPVICLTVIFLARMRIKQASEKKVKHSQEDEVIIEEIYHGLRDLHKRVENLETIMRHDETYNRQ